jgi:hypothetical protein
MTTDNPFAQIGAPPVSEDPEAQLSYLKQVVGAFDATGNPRIKPLRHKLEEALEKLARGTERNVDPERLAREFAADVDALRLQTYDLLLIVINQVRATLRVRLKQGISPSDRVDTEKLQKALAVFSQGLRKMLRARKNGDARAEEEAKDILGEAGRALEESGNQLMEW